MEVRAVAKFVRVQPRKVRIVADEVRGKSARAAVDVLRFHPSKGAHLLRKVIISAVANAVENHQANEDTLRVAKIMIDEGPRMKRIQARAMGRANRILKKMAHITVVVDEMEVVETVRPHGTQAKPRPTFAKLGKGKKAKAEAAPVEEVKEVEEVIEAQAEEVVEAAETETPVSEDKS